MAQSKNTNASTASLAEQNSDKPYHGTSFPTTLPTPAAVSPIASGAPQFPEPKRRKRIARILAHSDQTVDRLVKLLSTPSGVDATLSTLCYTLNFVHANVNGLLASQLQSIATRIIKNASDALLPGETVIASFPVPTLAAALAQASASSKALADLISDYRIFMRLWGLLGIYAWGKGVYLDPPKDIVLKRIAQAQVAVNTVYQITENLAYLGGHNVIRRSESQIGRDWLISSRCWALHIFLDFIRLYRVRMLWDREDNEDEKEAVVDIKEARAKRKADTERWWKALSANICYAPMSVHYSIPGGYLSEASVGLLGMLAGGAGLRQMWAATKAV